jgi:hypothetical protein
MNAEIPRSTQYTSSELLSVGATAIGGVCGTTFGIAISG